MASSFICSMLLAVLHVKMVTAVPRGTRPYRSDADSSSPGCEHSMAQISKIAAGFLFSFFPSPCSEHIASMTYVHIRCKKITALSVSKPARL